MSKRSRRFDDDDFDPPTIHTPITVDLAELVDLDDDLVDVEWSTYTHDDAMRGPQPPPDWVITSPAATDDDLGVLKTGKEADVSLLRRTVGDTSVLMAAKRYRSAQHRMFHRDSGYLEGRKEKKSRERRAMETRTGFGRELIAGRWASAEFDVLARVWSAGGAVPYPVQLLGTELLMEFIGTPDGVAAPRLAQIRPTPREAAELFAQLRDVLLRLAEIGYAHGDLSAYNILVDDGRLVLIDVPQAVDLLGNPQGFAFLRRDCENICAWFNARGLETDPAALATTLVDAT